MLLPDVTDAGRIVFIDYRPSHPRYAMLELAARGTCILEVKRHGERFEATITGLDMTIVDAQLQADLLGARRWLDDQAAAYMREVRRLDIARRLLDDVAHGCAIIRASLPAAVDTPARPTAALPWEVL